MKKLIPVFFASLLAVACTPMVFDMYLEVREASVSGYDLAGKSIGVVSMDASSPEDSSFTAAVANAFATRLDKEYFGSEGKVQLFAAPQTDSVSLETMHSLVMDTEQDVIFLVGSSLGLPTADTGVTMVNVSLNVYDSMGKDSVGSFSGHSLFKDPEGSVGTIASRMSTRFMSQWKRTLFTFYYFDSGDFSVWDKALEKVQEGDIPSAVKLWGTIASKGKGIRAACASYNIAQSFYLLGDYDLATRWLDKAEQMENVELAPTLRRKIAEKAGALK